MSTEYDLAKSAYDTPSTDRTKEVVASSSTTFMGELYNLLFRNQKAEFTIYSTSLVIALAYAMTKHFLLGAAQRSVLYEGSILALSSLVVLTLGHIIWVRNGAAHRDFLTRITIITRRVAFSATFAILMILAIGWIDLVIDRMHNEDDKLFGKIPIYWIKDLGYLLVTGNFLWDVFRRSYRKDKED